VKANQGKLDILVANAAIAEGASLEHVTEEHFDRHFDINVKGMVFTVQKALPLLSQGSSVIVTASISGIKGQAGLGIYSATKAAIRNLVRTWGCRLPKLRKALTPVRVTMLQASPHAIHFNRVLNLDEEQAGGRPLCY